MRIFRMLNNATAKIANKYSVISGYSDICKKFCWRTEIDGEFVQYIRATSSYCIFCIAKRKRERGTERQRDAQAT